MKKSFARIPVSAIVGVALATCALPAIAMAESPSDVANPSESIKGSESLGKELVGATTSSKLIMKPQFRIKGKTMVVKLTENITTGYSWKCKVTGKAVKLDKKRSGYIEPKVDEDICGAPGVHKYTFKTRKAGKTATIKMVYSQSFNKKSKKTTITMKVKTSKKGKISLVKTTVK